MEEIRSDIEKRKAGCMSCIRDHEICDGPKDRRCTRCAKRKSKCSRSLPRLGKTANPADEVAKHIDQAEVQGAAVTSAIAEVPKPTNSNPISSPMANRTAINSHNISIPQNARKNEPALCRIVGNTPVSAPTNLKDTASPSKKRESVDDEVNCPYGPQAKKIKWKDSELARGSNHSSNGLKIIVDKRMWEEVQAALRRTTLELEKLQNAIKIIERQL